jgi:hypothetical protein
MVKILFALVLLMPATTQAALQFEEGVAQNPESNAVLYREQHWLRSEGGRPVERLVLYRCPDGTAFGRKQIDYRKSLLAPAFRYDDRRTGYEEGLRDDRVRTVFVRSAARDAERSAPLSSNPLVVDAGFDEFVHSQWQELVSGKAVPLDFAVPARLESMGFVVRRIGQAQVAGESAWVFRLRLDSFIGWLAPHIDVSYGQQSRRLLRFEGLSNLRDDAGKNQMTARIDFPRSAQLVADEQWQAALQTPLLPCAIGR